MQKLIPAVLVLIAIGIFFVFTSPTYTGPVAEAKLEIKSLDSALAAAQEFSTQERNLKEERAALPVEGLERLNAFLPDNVNNIQLILDLDALAARSGVRLSNFDIGEQASGEEEEVQEGNLVLDSTDPVGHIDITVTAEGTYSSFRSFLEATEQSLRLLDLVGINIKSEPTGVYTYDMTFRIYWLQ